MPPVVPAWRASCVDCASRFFENAGLLFKDRELEVLYLTRSAHRKARRILLGALVAEGIAFSAWLALDIVGTGTSYQGVYIAETCVLVLIAACAIAGIVATVFAMADERRRYLCTALGAAFAMATVQVDVLSEVLWYNVFPNTSVDEVCWPGLNASQYPAAALEARECGSVQPLPPNCILLMAVLWATQCVILALNIVATRLFTVIAAFTALTLLVIGSLIVSNSIPWAEFECLAVVQTAAVNICFELFVWAAASSWAFLVAIGRREAATRELFVWTRRLNLDAEALQLEADPFHPDNLQRWLEAAGQSNGPADASDSANADANASASASASGDGGVPNKSGRSHRSNSSSSSSSGGGGGTSVHGSSNSASSTRGSKRDLGPDQRAHNGVEGEFWSIPASALVLESRIASGSGGAVWKATYNGDTPVAAKELFSTVSRPSVEELAHEAALLGQLSHDNVVKFLGLCALPADPSQHRTSPQLFIVQELCAANLRSVIGQSWSGSMTALALQLASGMEYLHQRSVVHRDLKPENVFLAGDGTVRIGDFGVSSQQPVLSVGRLATEHSLKAAAGTVQYLAPEVYVVVINEPNLALQAASPPVDVYAFGIILWEMMDGAAVNTVDVLSSLRQCAPAQLKANSTSLAILQSQVWEWPQQQQQSGEEHAVLHRLVSMCWQFDAGQRPTFAAIAARLSVIAAASDQARAINVRCYDHHEQHWPSAPGRMQNDTPLEMPLLARGRDGAPSTLALTSAPAAKLLASEFHSRGSHAKKASPHARWHSCWHRCGLHFRSHEMEARFVAYLRSDAFYSVLRWPYLIFAVLYLAQLATTLALSSEPGTWVLGVTPLLRSILFGVAAVFAWFLTKTQRLNSGVLSVLAALYSLVGAAVTLTLPFAIDMSANATTFKVLGQYSWAYAPLNSTSVFDKGALVSSTNRSQFITSVCAGRVECHDAIDIEACGIGAPDVVVSFTSSVLFQSRLGSMEYMLQFGLYTVEGLIAPVILMLFGLPFRHYICVIAVPAAVLIAKAFISYFAGTTFDSRIMPAMWNFDFHLVALNIIVPLVFTSCAVSVWLHERSQRRLFVLFCGLLSQKSTLTRDAAFRQYRRIMQFNREYFVRDPSRPQTVRATTVRTLTMN